MTVTCFADGPSDTITLSYRLFRSKSWLPRMAGVAAFLASLAIAALLLHRGFLWNWFVRVPYVFGVACGLAWWLWLSPSGLGLLIVLAVLAAQFVPWRRNPRLA